MKNGEVPPQKQPDDSKSIVKPSTAKPQEQHGQNLQQNTRNQGYQQDR